jgi:hypothetical protein
MPNNGCMKSRPRPDPPGYVAPYRRRHKPLTVTLTTEQHEECAGQAVALGLTPTTYATFLICGILFNDVTDEAVP